MKRFDIQAFELSENQIKAIAKNKSRTKFTKALTITLAGVLCGALIACKSEPTSKPITSPTSSENPNTELENPAVEAEIPTEEINKFVSSLTNDNYSFKKQIDGQLVAHYVDGNDLYIKISDDEKYYYTYENGQMYYFEYDQNEESWVKTKSTTLTNFDSLIYDTLNATEWKSYDEDANTVTGTYQAVEYSLNLSNGTLSGGIVGEIYNVDDTNVIIPTTYIDKTIEIDPTPSGPENPQDPENPENPEKPVEPPVSESENIYEIVGSEYVFDVVALKEVLLNWMQGDNQFGKDVYAEKKLSDIITDDIVFIEAEKEYLEMACIFSSENKKYFQRSYFNDETLYTKISNGEIQTKEEFENYLNSIVIKKFKFVDPDVEIDTTISATDFETLTENTFTKLEEKGTQGSSINNDFPETRLENFSDAEVLYGFKCVDGDVSAGADLGYRRAIKTYYLVNYNNNIEFINFELYGSTSNGKNNALENILENTNYWMIGYIDREDIDDNNAELYNEANAQTMSYSPEIDILLNKKEREFI